MKIRARRYRHFVQLSSFSTLNSLELRPFWSGTHRLMRITNNSHNALRSHSSFPKKFFLAEKFEIPFLVILYNTFVKINEETCLTCKLTLTNTATLSLSLT
jgi:hypothetical protein